MLEHRAPDNRAELLAGEIEAVDQPVERGGEHVLIGGVRVAPSDRANGIRLPPRTATRRIVLLAMGAILPTLLTLE